MIQTIPAHDRFRADHGWLKTFHLFSFADYYDPTNLQFGVLRVFNDDSIDAFSGFGDHGHADMEIVTIVFAGELSHRDSMGNAATINAGEVQRMTAGTGIVHAEKNLGKDPIHLFQIWFLPTQEGLTPSYSQKDFSTVSKKNVLLFVGDVVPNEEALKLNASAKIALSELEEGKILEYRPATGRGVFIYVREGAIAINGISAEAGDQARITEEALLKISATKNASFILIDVAR